MATRAKITTRYPTEEEIDDFLRMPKERARRLAVDVAEVRRGGERHALPMGDKTSSKRRAQKSPAKKK
jgi:hypothetical protein